MAIYMRIDTNESNVEIYGSADQHRMSVKNSSKLFTMLIDGLYKDKYGSIVRELSSNAWDAHKSAGKEHVPFHIDLPGEIEGKFIIRDFGNGLSKDEIVQFFGTLLESSKENDDTAIGAYGIGCKSPFSIVDEFMVISVKDNIKTSVTFARENKGVPQFFIVGESKTTEESGTKIIIDDRNTKAWTYAIQSQLAAFVVKPTTNIEIEYPEIEYYGNLGIIMADKNIMQHTCYINMGQVLYPLDISDFKDDDINFIKTNKTVIYKCSIGDITVPPDRERIELTDKTKNCIAKVVDEQHGLLKDLIVNKFKESFQYNYEWYTNFISKYKPLINNIETSLAECIENKFIDDEYLSTFKADNVLNFLKNGIIYRAIAFKKMPQLYVLDTYTNIAVADTQISPQFPNLFARNIPIVFIYDTTIADLSLYMSKNAIKSCILIRMKLKSLAYYKQMISDIAPFFDYKIEPVQLEKSVRKSLPSGMSRSNLPKQQKANLSGLYKFAEGNHNIINDTDLDILKNEECIVLTIKRNGSYTNNWSTKFVTYVSKESNCPPIFVISERRFKEFNNTVNKKMLSIKEFVVKNIISDKNRVYEAYIKRDILYELLYYKCYSESQAIFYDTKGLAKYKHSQYDDSYLESLSLAQIMKELSIRIPSACESVFNNIKIDANLGRQLITNSVEK